MLKTIANIFHVIKVGEQLKQTVKECDVTAASASAILDVGGTISIPSPKSLTSNNDQNSAKTTPVTLTHFQQMETGTLEKKIISESSNPFKNATADSTELRTGFSNNPFVVEPRSNNPFLLRLSSPLLNNRTTLQPIASEEPIIENLTTRSVSLFIYFLIVIFVLATRLSL